MTFTKISISCHEHLSRRFNGLLWVCEWQSYSLYTLSKIIKALQKRRRACDIRMSFQIRANISSCQIHVTLQWLLQLHMLQLKREGCQQSKLCGNKQPTNTQLLHISPSKQNIQHTMFYWRLDTLLPDLRKVTSHLLARETFEVIPIKRCHNHRNCLITLVL